MLTVVKPSPLSQFETVSAGERLFALPVTDFPELQYVKKELNILNKLYQLYNNVMDTVEAWMDTIWEKVNVEVMIETLENFSKLSRSVRVVINHYYLLQCFCVRRKICSYVF